MTAPTVAANAVGNNSTASTSHTVTLTGLGTISSGDLLVCCFAYASATANAGNSSGWTEVDDTAPGGGEEAHALFRLQASGGETTLTVTTGGSVESAWTLARITGHENPSTQELETGTASGTSTTPDPPNVSVTGGPKDILVIASYAGAKGRWASAYPSDLADNQVKDRTGTTVGDTSMSMATGEKTSQTAYNPNSFTCSSEDWCARTTIVHEASAAAATPLLMMLGVGS